jgi:hypothetical protein
MDLIFLGCINYVNFPEMFYSMRKVGRNEPCPCGSGKKYKECCYSKDFEWMKNGDGNYIRVIPMNNELKEVLIKQHELFLSIFQREPKEDDPVFLMKYLYSDDDIDRYMFSKTKEALIDPALFYAYKKTGKIITEENLSIVPQMDIEKWKSAIEEYYERIESEEEVVWEPTGSESIVEELSSEIDPSIFTFGLYMDKIVNKTKDEYLKYHKGIVSPLAYIFFCFTRTLKTLRTIRFLLHEHLSDEALMLCRSIYENYLHIIFIKKNPEKVRDLVNARIGIQIGTYEYKRTPKGKLNYRIIIEKETQEEFEGHISALRMAKASSSSFDVKLFNYLYKELSKFIHPNFLNIDSYMSEIGFDHLTSGTWIKACLYTIFLSALILSELQDIQGVSKIMRSDIETFLLRVQPKILSMLILLNESSTILNFWKS